SARCANFQESLEVAMPIPKSICPFLPRRRLAAPTLSRQAALRPSVTPWRGSPLEMLFEALPAGIVVALQRLGFEREAGGSNDETSLEHEGERVLDLVRLQFGLAGPLEGDTVRA